VVAAARTQSARVIDSFPRLGGALAMERQMQAAARAVERVDVSAASSSEFQGANQHPSDAAQAEATVKLPSESSP
jgi:hypothetical protein